MSLPRAVLGTAFVLVAGLAWAQAPQAPAGGGQSVPAPAPAPAQPPATGAPAPGVPAPGTPGAPVPGAPLVPTLTRGFTAPTGLWFLTVRLDRVQDFEQLLAHLQAALAKTTNARVRQQSASWRMLKAAEPGPNGTVLYAFLFDPTVPGADYGLGRVLVDAYGDSPQLQEIWKLYTGSVTGGGTLLNLSPVVVPKLLPLATPGATPTAPAPTAPPAVPPAK